MNLSATLRNSILLTLLYLNDLWSELLKMEIRGTNDRRFLRFALLHNIAKKNSGKYLLMRRR